MKRKMNILKYLKKGLILNFCLIFSTPSFSNFDYNNENDIRTTFNKEISSLFKSYKSTQPLTADILNSGDPNVLSFLKGISKHKEGHGLAVNYFKNFKVSGVDTSFCLIFYEPKNNIFKDYIKKTEFNQEDAITYLIWHEMGHCFAFHETFLKNERDDEKIADMFAIALSLNNKKEKMAITILKELKNINYQDIHSNIDYLKKFHHELKLSELLNKELSINQILAVIFYYYNNNSFDGFTSS